MKLTLPGGMASVSPACWSRPEKAAAFSGSILSMTTAYGLAIQALGLAPINANLLPIEIARKMMWKRKTPWFVGAASLIVVGALALAGSIASWPAAANDFWGGAAVGVGSTLLFQGVKNAYERHEQEKREEPGAVAGTLGACAPGRDRQDAVQRDLPPDDHRPPDGRLRTLVPGQPAPPRGPSCDRDDAPTSSATPRLDALLGDQR